MAGAVALRIISFLTQGSTQPGLLEQLSLAFLTFPGHCVTTDLVSQQTSEMAVRPRKCLGGIGNAGSKWMVTDCGTR